MIWQVNEKKTNNERARILHEVWLLRFSPKCDFLDLVMVFTDQCYITMKFVDIKIKMYASVVLQLLFKGLSVPKLSLSFLKIHYVLVKPLQSVP